MTKITQEALSQFYGSECLFSNPLFSKFSYTEGIKWLGDNGAGWLVTDILSLQGINDVKEQEFQAWDLTVNKDGSGELICSDGNGNTVYTQKLEYTDFPLPSIKLFFTNNVLMLTSEY